MVVVGARLTEEAITKCSETLELGTILLVKGRWYQTNTA